MSTNASMKEPVTSTISQQMHDELIDVLSHLDKKGVCVWTEGGQLCYRGPREALTATDVETLRSHKSELVAYLTNGDEPRRAGWASSQILPEPSSLPLSFSQRLHWHTHGLSTGRSPRTVACATRIVGPLNLDALQRSFAEIVRRHDALRTRIVVRDGIPWQEFTPAHNMTLHVSDFRDHSDSDCTLEVQKCLDNLLLAGINVLHDPLLTAQLLRLRNEEHVLIVAMEHLIGDAVSLNILLNQLFVAYRQAARGDPFSWPDTPLQFGEHVLEQLDRGGRLPHQHSESWGKHLKEHRRLRFPAANASGQRDRSGWGIYCFQIGRPLTEQLHEWSRRMRTTPVMAAFIAYVALVLRWCDVWETVVLYQTDGRGSARAETALGYFASVLFLPIKAHSGFNFLHLMEEVTRQYYMAYEDADLYPLHTGLPQHEYAHNTCFNWLPRPASLENVQADAAADALQLTPIPIEYTVLPDLTVDTEPEMALIETDGGIEVRLGYSRGALTDETIEQFGLNYALFIESLLKAPQHRLCELKLL